MSATSRRALLSLGGALLVFVGRAGSALGQDLRFLRMGTGGTGGTYFPVGGLIANAISNPPGSMECEFGGSCGVPGVVVAAVSTQGSVENVSLVASKRLDLCISQADVAYFAYKGANWFASKPPLANLRVIANLYPEMLHVVVRRDAGISSLGDLRGKRISLGEPDSGTLVGAKLVLDAIRLPLKQIKASYENLYRSVDQLIAGRLDGLFMMAGYPVTAIVQAADAVDIALLSIQGPAIDPLFATYPFFSSDRIPAGIYRNVAAADTLAVGAQLIVAAEMPEPLAYEITRALWDPRNRRILDSGHSNGKLIRLETALRGIAVPLHPGAVRYYRSVRDFGGEPGDD
jgi:hypothetical protein